MYIIYVCVGDITELTKEVAKISVKFTEVPKQIADATVLAFQNQLSKITASDAKTKDFNSLNHVLGEFKFTSLELSEILRHVNYGSCLDLVRNFAHTIKINYDNNHKGEIEYVQPVTRELMTNLVSLVFDSSATMKAEYYYEDIEFRQIRHTIDGKIDEAIVFGGIFETPLFTVEDKNMTISLDDLSTKSEAKTAIVQAFSHVMCGITQISLKFDFIPPNFYGALTNGRQWIFLLVNSTKKDPSYKRTVVMNILNPTNHLIDDSSVALVAQYLLLCLTKMSKILGDNGHPLIPPTVMNISTATSSGSSRGTGRQSGLGSRSSHDSGRIGGGRGRIGGGRGKSSGKGGSRTSTSLSYKYHFVPDKLTDENLRIHNIQNFLPIW